MWQQSASLFWMLVCFLTAEELAAGIYTFASRGGFLTAEFEPDMVLVIGK